MLCRLKFVNKCLNIKLFDSRNFGSSSLTSASSVKLNDGNSLPLLGFGTFHVGDTEANAHMATSVSKAISSGYRHIDLAPLYGNQAAIGNSISKAIQSNICKREELFITSKLWNTDHHPSRVETALKATLQQLKVQYLDLYLIHTPAAFAPSEDGETNP